MATRKRRESKKPCAICGTPKRHTLTILVNLCTEHWTATDIVHAAERVAGDLAHGGYLVERIEGMSVESVAP